MAVKKYTPAWLDVVRETTPVAVLESVTLAAGITALLWSRTVPLTVLVLVWDHAAGAKRKASERTETKTMGRCITVTSLNRILLVNFTQVFIGVKEII